MQIINHSSPSNSNLICPNNNRIKRDAISITDIDVGRAFPFVLRWSFSSFQGFRTSSRDFHLTYKRLLSPMPWSSHLNLWVTTAWVIRELIVNVELFKSCSIVLSIHSYSQISKPIENCNSLFP
jgi:hypothetical protein